MNANSAYEELIRRSREMTLLASCEELLGWDELTYLPRGGVEHRSHQMALLAGLTHERATDPRLGELLSAVEGSSLTADATAPSAVNIREMRRAYDRRARLPRTLVEELARTTSLAQQAWEVARKNDDFAHFLPWLKKVLALRRREAEHLACATGIYDALLQEYEPDATSQEIIPLFAELRRELVTLLSAIQGAGRQPNEALLHREYALERQRMFGEMVAAAAGFDFRRGRLDTAVHPFCSGIGPGDCRITVRYSAHNFSEAFFTVLHEVGHGLYEQGLDPEHHGTPMGEGPSLALHESQSRLWENVVGRCRPFWEHFFPLARRVFHDALQESTLDQFHFAINAVRPSLIRVQADEVTYNLHIMIRFELEHALLEGELAPADLPAAWNEAYGRELGLEPASDADGCLQDGHWGSGMFGYFPTYTLGNLFAAQLFARADEDVGGLSRQFACGSFDGLLGWLRTNVHRQGSRYSAARLVENVTGVPPNPRPLVQALWRKYGELYGL